MLSHLGDILSNFCLMAHWWASANVIITIDIMGAGVSAGTTTSMATDTGEVPSSLSHYPFAAPTYVGVGMGAWLAMVIVIITGVVRLAIGSAIIVIADCGGSNCHHHHQGTVNLKKQTTYWWWWLQPWSSLWLLGFHCYCHDHDHWGWWLALTVMGLDKLMGCLHVVALMVLSSCHSWQQCCSLLPSCKLLLGLGKFFVEL